MELAQERFIANVVCTHTPHVAKLNNKSLLKERKQSQSYMNKSQDIFWFWLCYKLETCAKTFLIQFF